MSQTQTNDEQTKYALVCVLCKRESPAYTITELKTLMTDRDRSIVSDWAIRRALDTQLTKLGWDCRSKRGEHAPYCHRCARFA